MNEFFWVTLPKIVLIGLPLIVGISFARFLSREKKKLGVNWDKTDCLSIFAIIFLGIFVVFLGICTAFA